MVIKVGSSCWKDAEHRGLALRARLGEREAAPGTYCGSDSAFKQGCNDSGALTLSCWK